MAFQRYRVAAGKKPFSAKGPDLLRKRDNARARVKNIMAGRHEGWFVRDDKTTQGPFSKAQALDEFDRWARRPGQRGDLRFLHRDQLEARCRYERVERIDLPNTSPATIEIHSLVVHQFPKVRFAGAYFYRKVAGSTSWSDHAWGTALDETENPPEPMNDETTDWLSRMGKAGCMKFDYALGSKNGNVVQVGAPDYDIEPSSAASSHLWHNHISETDHDGQKPPRQGGVW